MSIKSWVEAAFSGGAKKTQKSPVDVDELEDLAAISKDTGAAIAATIRDVKAEILELEAAQKSGANQSEESAKKLAKLRERYDDLSEAMKVNRRDLKKHTADLESHRKEVEKTGKGYSEYAKDLAEAGSAQGVVSKLVSDASSRLKGHTTLIIATGVATRAWSMHMKAAARGAKDLLNAGAPLPVNQERLNEALEASEVRFQKVNGLAAVMAMRYGIAADQVNQTADIIQEKLRLLDKDFNNSATLTGETITQLTRNSLLFARTMRVDVGKAVDYMERRFWDMGGSPQSKLKRVRTEMRAVYNAVMDINKNGSDIFPEDMANNVLEAASATESYGKNLVALTSIMATAYKRSGELGASYRQQVRIGSQMIKGLQNVDDSIAYMAGRRLLTRANADIESLVEGLDEGKQKRVRNVVKDKKVGDFDKARILQEILGQETVGIEETLNVSGRFTRGQVGTGIFKDLFGFESLEDSYMARDIFQNEGAAGVKKFVDDVKAREKAAAEGEGGELFTAKEQGALQQVVGREEASVLAKFYNAAPEWLKPTLDKVAEMANNSVGLIQIGAGVIGMHMLMKLFLGKRNFPVPLPVVMSGGGPGGGFQHPMYKKPQGRLGRIGGGLAKFGPAAAAGAMAYSMFGGEEEQDLSNSVMDAAQLSPEDQEKLAAGQNQEEPGFVERNGGWLGLGMTGLTAAQLGSWAVKSRAGGATANLAGRSAAGVGRLAAQGAARGGGALLRGGAALASNPVGMVLGAGALGYSAGTFIDQYAGRLVGSKKAISTGIAEKLTDGKIAKAVENADFDEARKWGLSDAEYFQYVLGGKVHGDNSDARKRFAEKQQKAIASGDASMRSPEEVYKVMLEQGRGKMAAARSLAAQHNFEDADSWELRKHQESTKSWGSMPDALKGSYMGQMWKSNLDSTSERMGVRGGVTPGGSLAAGMSAFNRPARGNEMILQPMRVAPDGSLKLELPGFYSLLEGWMDDRSILKKSWRYLTGGK